jgi:hypothetical protein
MARLPSRFRAMAASRRRRLPRSLQQGPHLAPRRHEFEQLEQERHVVMLPPHILVVPCAMLSLFRCEHLLQAAEGGSEA